MQNVQKHFGSFAALTDVSIELAKGEVRAICGENGAGKSTLLKVLMGIHKPDGGTITVDGEKLSIGSPQDAQRAGIALVAQELSLAPHLSILDNIWLGNREVPLFHRRKSLRDRALQALSTLGVSYDLDKAVKHLTMGERQIVEIARLLVKDARILILDEPTATLSDVEIDRMMEALRKLKASGKSILYVTHRLGEVFDICDTVSVLRNGKNVAQMPISAIGRDELIELMLGRSFSDMYPDRFADPTNPATLTISGLSLLSAVKNIDLTAQRGRITTIAGQVGSGANFVVRAIAGLEPDAVASITLDGAAISLSALSRKLGNEITFVSEDRAQEGLFRRNVLENVVASRFPDHRKWGVLSWRSLTLAAVQACLKVAVDKKRLSANAFSLSGGNQQKLLFGRAIGCDIPGLLLINEPTRGVDVGARAEIYKLIREFCRLNYVVLLTSSDLEEIVGISDRVFTMFKGEIVNQYDGAAISAATILADLIHPTRQSAVTH